MLKAILGTLCLPLAALAGAATLTIPSADGPLTIDGVINEEIWQRAAVLPVKPPEFGAPFPGAGEIRVILRGDYLCFSARIPETGRVVARSTGRDPVWWREDLVAFTVAFKAFSTTFTVTMNPLGAYSAGYAYRLAPMQAPEQSRPVLAQAMLGPDGWCAEAAIPLANIGAIGFIYAERIRAPRPDAPELRWNWPALNDRLAFRFAPGRSDVPAPQVVSRDLSAATKASVPVPEPYDSLAAELASVPRHVWTDAERKGVAADRMWDKHLRSRVLQAAVAERKDWQKVATVADWEKFRDRRLAALRRSLEPFPERTPLRAAVTRRLDYGDGFVIENVLFESRPGLVVTANFYLPAKMSGRVPAIVVVHAHHSPKAWWELQDLGMTWARTGTAVLIMDQLGAGERIQSQPWLRESYYSRYALGMQLYVAGESLMKWMVWDLMRGIDLLLERPYIDPQRIVMLGSVAGGGDPAAVTAALDERIAAVVPFNFGEAGPEEHYLEGPRPYDFDTAYPGWGEWESTRGLRRSIADQFFPWFICASVAPRHFLYSFELEWPGGVEKQPAWARYKKVFELYGKRDHLDQLDGYGPFPGPGEVTHVGVLHRQQMYPIFKRWLDIQAPAREYHNVRPESDLMCLTPQAAAERRPKTASEIAAGLARERLDAVRARRAALAPAERLASLRASLRDKLGDIEPATAVSARVLWTKPFSNFAVEAITVETEPGLGSPVMLIKPAGSSGKRLPIVLALAQGGTEAFLSGRRAELSVLLKQGVAVCLADVRGTGEIGRDRATSEAATELMLGGTALGARLKDVRTVLRYLATRPDVDAKRVVLWGDSFTDPNPRDLMLDQSLMQQPGPQTIRQADPLGSVLALMVALYENDVRAVAARGGLVSYLSMLQDRFCYVPQDVVVPGILETADVGDIVSALAPRAGRSRPERNQRQDGLRSGSGRGWLSAPRQARSPAAAPQRAGTHPRRSVRCPPSAQNRTGWRPSVRRTAQRLRWPARQPRRVRPAVALTGAAHAR